jgi:predicted DNA binding protein
MRRLILEVSEKELSKIGVDLPPFDRIESLELLHILKHDQEELAAVWRLELKNATTVNDLLKGGFLVEIQVLAAEKNRKYIVFMRTGPIISTALNFLNAAGGYLFSPLEIRDGKMKISFIGSERQMQDFFAKVSERGIRYKVTSLTDASFSPDSPLNKLTEKQRQVLLAAHKFGYYDVPRKVSSEQLAQKLGIGDSTLVEHLRKAEKRLIDNILKEH